MSATENGRAQFKAAAPRRFLYPAILLLLAEQPRHGYRLLEALPGLGIGHIDRAGVYRTLADLAQDGLIHSWDEVPSAGSTRHVYELTDAGVEVLEEWMSVVATERSTLDAVLQRYWYCNAHPWTAPVVHSAVTAPVAGDDPRETVDFIVAVDRSNLTVEARSTVGPIAFCTTRLRGWVSARLCDGLVSVDQPPAGHLELDLDSLSSGNALYDSELQRRVESRRHPTVSVDLRTTNRLGEGNCYEALGDVTMRGVTRRLAGSLTVTVQECRRRRRASTAGVDRRMTITGERTLDLRDFHFEPPAMPMFKLYPDVRLHLHLEADAIIAEAVQ